MSNTSSSDDMDKSACPNQEIKQQDSVDPVASKDGAIMTLDVKEPEKEAVKPPPVWIVHVGLFIVQFCFGINTVIGKLGLGGGTNPIFLALLREAIAGPVLFGAALYFERQFIKKNWVDWALFLASGTALFVNQLCYIVGLKFADSTTASVWQLTQPIFTILLTLALRMERPTVFNITGVLISIGGAVFMVLYGKIDKLKTQGGSGHICFFFNCLATSLYVICSKPLVRSRGYKPTTVIGLAYCFAACIMFLTNMICDWWDTALNKLCPDCHGNAFHFPQKAVGALASNVILASIFSYSLMTWCNKWIYATIVSAYLVVQPMTAIILAVILHKLGVSGMDAPGLNDLGILPILVGLALIIGGNVWKDKKMKEEAQRKADEEANKSTVAFVDSNLSSPTMAPISSGRPF